MSQDPCADRRAALQSAPLRRIEQVTATNRPEIFLEPGVAEQMRELTARLAGEPRDLSLFLLGWGHWYRHISLSEDQDQAELASALYVLSPWFQADTEPQAFPGPVRFMLAKLAVRRAEAMLRDLEQTDDLGLWQRVVAAVPDDDEDRPSYLTNLANALIARSTRTGDPHDLDEAISDLRSALALAPADDPGRKNALTNLGGALLTKFFRAGEQADLDEGISQLRAALALTPSDDPDLYRHLSNLATALQDRFERRGKLTDLDQAIGHLRAAAEITPPDRAERAEVPNNLGIALMTRFDRTAAPADLDQAIENLREALAIAGQDRPSQAHVLNNYGNALTTRYSRSGGLGDLDNAVAYLRQAAAVMPLDHPDRKNTLGNAGNTLQQRFRRLGVQADLDEAISDLRAALDATPPGRPDRPGRLSDLAAALIVKFGRTATIRIGAQASLREILGWLWDHGVGPVVDALGYRDTPAPGAPLPRVWWAPGGLLSLLPVHAAGQALDRVVSSYTFTVASLRHTRRHPSSFEPTIALIVAMPTTPDIAGRLEHAAEEARRVAAHWPRSVTLIEAAPGADRADDADDKAPNSANVLRLLPSCGVAHFACHGTTDPADPGRSCLFLEDHLMVAALTTLSLTSAGLAYLSACQTAITTDERLLDEAIHLAFQLAGYSHVIGTLWTIRDERALDIADAFYTSLTEVTPAEALHAAVRSQREQFPLTPSLWPSTSTSVPDQGGRLT
jgi:tetratricopeptide (TPR) repeat protein